MPKLEKCNSDCQAKPSILCRHRFNNSIKVLYSTAYIEFLRYYDFQIILHCLYLINKSRLYRNLAKNGRFFIVTKDRTFLRDAEKLWLEKKKKNTHPVLQFGENFVSWGGLRINVEVIQSRNYGTNGHDDLNSVFRKFNDAAPK